MAAEPTADAAALIEQLLLDPTLRTRFRADPVGVCRDLGMADLGEELAGVGRGVETIELRESRSSLAGVIFAAAAEGISVVRFAEEVLPHAHGHAAHVAAAAVANATRHGFAVVPAPAEAAPAPPVAGASMVGMPAVSGSPALSISAEAQGALQGSPEMSARLSRLAASLPGHQLTVGSVSGGQVEITAVDGQPVSPANIGARDMLQQLAALPAGSRPSAVEAPWAVDEPGFSVGRRHAVLIDLAGSAPGMAGDTGAAPEALAAVAAAKRQIGEPYVWGGESRKVGFDCSGLVQWAYERAGVHSLGRTTWTQATQGTAVQWGHFKPGDLIFSNWEGGHDPEHVVMYIGDGKVVAAPHTGTDVQIQSVGLFRDHFVSARRIVAGHGAGPSEAPQPVAAGQAAPVAAPAAESAGAMAEGLAADPQALRAAVAVKIAQRYLGTPYVYGGESPSGFDCSGLMQYVWGKVGVHLDRVSEDQYFNGKPVPRDQLEPGDLVFFRLNGDIHHVGMYVGHGRFIEAPHTGDVVKYARLDDPYYKPQYAGARRVSGLAAGDAPMPQWAVREVEQASGKATPTPVASAAAGPPVSGAYPAAQPAGTAQLGVAPPVDAHASAADGMDLGDVAYPGDNAPRAEIAQWMAAEARKHGLPPELPVMAALTESGLRNLNYGDRDSVGFFQMRSSVWEGEYPGFGHKPELQLRWFIHQAVEVRRMRVAEGYHNYGKDPGSWGNWVADVERCAAQYRYRYQEQLGTARNLVNDPGAGA